METNKITASVHFIGDNNSNTCSSFQFSKKTLEWSMMSSRSLLINYFPHPVYQRGFSNHFPAKWHEEHPAFSNTIWARIVVTRGAFFFQDHKTVESAISRIQFRSCWFFLFAAWAWLQLPGQRRWCPTSQGLHHLCGSLVNTSVSIMCCHSTL